MYVHPFNGDLQNLFNEQVRFHISDVFVPKPEQILAELHIKDLLQGKVVDFSDNGSEKDAFVVVEVDGLRDAVVVPASKIVCIAQ